MLTLVQDHPIEASLSAHDGARVELDRLNAELKELKSTEFAVRAYIETWMGAVGFLALGKLVYDWQRTHSKPPLILLPLLLLASSLLADSIVYRVKQFRLARVENEKLERQRALRGELGIDDAVFPSDRPV